MYACIRLLRVRQYLMCTWCCICVYVCVGMLQVEEGDRPLGASRGSTSLGGASSVVWKVLQAWVFAAASAAPSRTGEAEARTFRESWHLGVHVTIAAHSNDAHACCIQHLHCSLLTAYILPCNKLLMRQAHSSSVMGHHSLLCCVVVHRGSAASVPRPAILSLRRLLIRASTQGKGGRRPHHHNSHGQGRGS